MAFTPSTLTPHDPVDPINTGAPAPSGGRRHAAAPPGLPPDVYIPPTIEITHPDVTERVAQGTREVMLPGVDGVRAWGYARQRVAGKLQYTFKQGTNDVWLVIELGKGEADALIQCTKDGVDATALNGIEFWWYPGTPTGTVDTHLAAVDPSWNEAFPGTIHAVVHLFRLDVNWPQIPNLLWEMRMYKPIDPRTDARAYSENLIVQWYDFLLDPEGKNLPAARVNKQSFIDAANIADQAVGSRIRFTGHMLMLEAVNPDDVIKSFRLMTDSYFFFENGKWKVVCDRPGSAVASYGDSALSRSFKPQGFREDDLERPTKVIVEITDVTNDWKPKQVFAIPAGTPAGTEDDSPITYKMPWIHDEGMGQSRAVYIANSYAFDMQVRVRWNATTSASLLGDLVTQALNARGLSFTGRLLSKTKSTRKTLFDVVLLEYNAARYSNDVVAAVAKTPSTLPQPGDVPPDVSLASVTIVEEPYLNAGTVKTRARIQITNPNFYFLDAVELWFSINGGAYRYYSDFPGGSGSVVPLTFDSINDLNVPYSFKFITRSKFGPKSAGAVKTPATTFVGKTTLPSDVVGLTGGANGAQVFLWWQASADTDITSYEIRRGLPTDTWSTAVYAGQTKVLHWPDSPPFGTQYRYFVKAIDASGGYSANPATFDIVMNAVGAKAAEVSNRIGWSSADFTRLLGAGSQGGLWRGSGNLFVSETLGARANGLAAVRAWLCRTDVGRVAAETERAAHSYTLAQWRTLIDDPRRGGAPLWAPLPTNAQGEIYGFVGFQRLAEHRVRLLSVMHAGLDTPQNVAIAQPWFGLTLTSKNYGNVILTPPDSAVYFGGLRLSTNSPFYQQIVSDDGFGNLFGDSVEKKTFTFAEGTATTDGSGLVTISHGYKPFGAVTGTRWLSATVIVAGSSNRVVIVDNIDVGGMAVRFKSYDVAGAAVAAVTFNYKLIDNAGTVAAFFW